MSYFNEIKIIDEYGQEVENTAMNEMRVVNPVRLAGTIFSNNVLDPNFWVSATTSTGTIQVTNGQAILSTGTNAAGLSSMTSNRTAQYTAASQNRYRGQIQLSDTGVASNYKQWGVATDSGATNGAWFELSGTTLYVVTSLTGSTTKTSITPPILTNVNVYEIYYTNDNIIFSINGELVLNYKANLNPWSSSLNLKIINRNVNVGNSTNTSLISRVESLSRMGTLESNPTSFHGTTAASTQLKFGSGKLHRLVLNNAGGSLISIYDSINSATNTIAIINTPATANAVSLPYFLPFSNGLYVVTTGTWDYTIIYE